MSQIRHRSRPIESVHHRPRTSQVSPHHGSGTGPVKSGHAAVADAPKDTRKPGEASSLHQARGPVDEYRGSDETKGVTKAEHRPAPNRDREDDMVRSVASWVRDGGKGEQPGTDPKEGTVERDQASASDGGQKSAPDKPARDGGTDAASKDSDAKPAQDGPVEPTEVNPESRPVDQTPGTERPGETKAVDPAKTAQADRLSDGNAGGKDSVGQMLGLMQSMLEKPSGSTGASGASATGATGGAAPVGETKPGDNAQKPDVQALRGQVQQLQSQMAQMRNIVGALKEQKGKMKPDDFNKAVDAAMNLHGIMSGRIDDVGRSLGMNNAPPPGTEPGSKVQWMNLGAQRNIGGSGMLNDVRRHLNARDAHYANFAEEGTAAHEGTHGLNSYVSNNFRTPNGQRGEGFYVGDNKAVVLDKPNNTRLSDVAANVPQSLRDSRYNLYLNQQRQYFENNPLYVMDEMSSYTNGAKADIEAVRGGRWRGGGQDAVKGSLEFTGYAMALGRTLEQKDPNYMRNNTQFREFLAHEMVRAMDTYRDGSTLRQFQGFGQDRLLRNLQTGSDAAGLRDFVRRNYGEAFLNRMLYGANGR